jgi:O-antigen/teichoic acid export membrane protein
LLLSFAGTALTKELIRDRIHSAEKQIRRIENVVFVLDSNGLEMHGDRRSHLSHAGIYFLARGLPGIISFLAIPLFTQLLEPAEYGQYALVISIMCVLNAAFFQWLRLSMVRFMPAHKNDAARFKSTLATTSLILIVALGLLAALAYLLPIGSYWHSAMLLAWGLTVVQALFDLCCEFSRSTIRPWRYMVMQLTRSLVSIGLGVTLVVLGWGWWGPIVGLGTGMALAVIYAARMDWSDFRFSIDRPILKKIIHYGMPLSLTVALAIVISSSDRFLIKWFLGDDATGHYAAAFDFTTQTLTMLMMVINMAMFPLAVRAWENHGRQAAQEQMRSNASLLMAVGFPCVVGMSILAPGISWLFLDDRYSVAATSIMPLIAIGSFLEGLKAYHFDAAFQFAHRTIYQVWIVLLVAVVNIALNVVMIPRWGINGSAGASVLAYAISITLTAYFGRRHFTLPFPAGSVLRVIFAAGLMSAVLYPFRNTLGYVSVPAQILGGAVVYGTALLATNFLGLRDSLFRSKLPLHEMPSPEPPVRIATSAVSPQLADVN